MLLLAAVVLVVLALEERFGEGQRIAAVRSAIDGLEGWDGRSRADVVVELGAPESDEVIDLVGVPEIGVSALDKLQKLRGRHADLSARWCVWTGEYASTHVWFAELSGEIVGVDAVRAARDVGF